jgi:AAA15 family ATPase/GTPase
LEHIKNIEIKNFKSIRHQVIDGCKRINVFIGYPNVGKSNILEAIGLYSSFQIQNENFKFNDICRVKHFFELFFNKDYRSVTQIDINNNLILKLGISQLSDLSIDVQRVVDQNGKTDSHTVFSATVNNRDFFYKITRAIIELDYKDVAGPIRKYEFKSDTLINQQKPHSLAVPFGINLLDILQGNSELRKEVAALFEEYGLKLFIDGEEIKFLKYLSDGSGVSIPYHQIADTLRRLIFYKAAIMSNKSSVLLFEEPEAHMFPPYMRKFTTDVIFDKTNQFFIATHSPYVLDAFLEDAPDELAIYLVYYEKGETKVKRMEQKDMDEVRAYGVDLFFNLESYLKHGQIDNA